MALLDLDLTRLALLKIIPKQSKIYFWFKEDKQIFMSR